jgi:hypothetical protein
MTDEPRFKKAFPYQSNVLRYRLRISMPPPGGIANISA